MKSKILTIALVFVLFLQQSKVFSQCLVTDPLNQIQTTLAATTAGQQLTQLYVQYKKLQQQFEEAVKQTKLGTKQLEMLTKAQNLIGQPNNIIVGPVYEKIVALCKRVDNLTSVAVLAGFLGTMQGKLGAEGDRYQVSVALFIAAVKINGNDILNRAFDLKANEADVDGFGRVNMNEFDRQTALEKLEKDASVLISATKLYYARVQKILVAKKGVSASSMGFLKKVIS